MLEFTVFGILVKVSLSVMLLHMIGEGSLALFVFTMKPELDRYKSRYRYLHYAVTALTASFLGQTAILIHEMGHALTAKYSGMKCIIENTLSGARTLLPPEVAQIGPWQEICISIAGPSSTIAFAFMLLILGWRLRNRLLGAGLIATAYIQLYYGIANLLPIPYQDGYFVYNAILALLRN